MAYGVKFFELSVAHENLVVGLCRVSPDQPSKSLDLPHFLPSGKVPSDKPAGESPMLYEVADTYSTSCPVKSVDFSSLLNVRASGHHIQRL